MSKGSSLIVENRPTILIYLGVQMSGLSFHFALIKPLQPSCETSNVNPSQQSRTVAPVVHTTCLDFEAPVAEVKPK